MTGDEQKVKSERFSMSLKAKKSPKSIQFQKIKKLHLEKLIKESSGAEGVIGNRTKVGGFIELTKNVRQIQTEQQG